MSASRQSFRVDRRSFVAALGGTISGLALGVCFPSLSRANAVALDAAPKLEPSLFVAIDPDGTVSIVCHRSEMGQGIRSTLPIVVADELGVDLARIRIVQGDGNERYGDQNTDGSKSVRDCYHAMRVAGATARTMLVTAAAMQMKVPIDSLVVRDHAVHHASSGRTLGLGELAAAAAKLAVPEESEIQLQPDTRLRYVGTDLPLVDARAYVTGTARFGADIRVPGMLTALVARPPVVGGTVKSFDDAIARKIAGVVAVVKLPEWSAPAGFQPLGGVAVVAEHTYAAMRGRAALQIEWDHGSNATYDSRSYREVLQRRITEKGEAEREVGDVDSALESAARIVSADYYVPHLVHVPMEPLVAVARASDEACEIWAPTQHPQAAAEEVAKVLDLDASAVTVHVTYLGGGFGRKSKPDFVVEAALLSKAVGSPVRVQWTREDEIQHAYYHAVSLQRLEAGLNDAGRIVGWRHRIASPPISSTFIPGAEHLGVRELQQGILDLPLAIPNVRVETCKAEAHVRIGWLRSVYNINHAFSVQSFISEIAADLGRDPRDVLLETLGPPRFLGPKEAGVDEIPNYGKPLEEFPIDVGRLRRVIERVTASCEWTTARMAGRALGLAAHRSFLSYVAVVISVVEDEYGAPRVDEAWLAADVGKIVNRDRVRSQMEGAVVFGMSLALHGAVTMRDGAVVQTNFHDYRICRIGEVPRSIHVDLVESEDPPAGVGEPGVPPVAPALANAIFARTGKRVREFPMLAAFRG